MKVRDLANALDAFPGDAEIQCGLSVPSMYINTVANLSISGNTVNPAETTVVRIIAAAPPLQKCEGCCAEGTPENDETA
jgi:hypothetical protein